jgi:hypothetical protein
MNLNAVTAKYAWRAKLVGMGLGVSTKTLAAGCAARNASIGGGLDQGFARARPRYRALVSSGRLFRA